MINSRVNWDGHPSEALHRL